MAKSILDLERAIAQLNQQKLQLMTLEANKRRALETKQKAILGGWLMAHDPVQVRQIVARLKRPQDRKAFGLDVLVESTADNINNLTLPQIARPYS